MILLHFKSGTWKTRLWFLFLLLGITTGASIFIVGISFINTLTMYGVYTEIFFIGLIMLEFILSKYVVLKLIDYKKGIPTKDEKIFIFMNIDFKREEFKKSEFKEYVEHYEIFYKKIRKMKW